MHGNIWTSHKQGHWWLLLRISLCVYCDTIGSEYCSVCERGWVGGGGGHYRCPCLELTLHENQHCSRRITGTQWRHCLQSLKSDTLNLKGKIYCDVAGHYDCFILICENSRCILWIYLLLNSTLGIEDAQRNKEEFRVSQESGKQRGSKWNKDRPG